MQGFELDGGDILCAVRLEQQQVIPAVDDKILDYQVGVILVVAAHRYFLAGQRIDGQPPVAAVIDAPAGQQLLRAVPVEVAERDAADIGAEAFDIADRLPLVVHLVKKIDVGALAFAGELVKSDGFFPAVLVDIFHDKSGEVLPVLGIFENILPGAAAAADIRVQRLLDFLLITRGTGCPQLRFHVADAAASRQETGDQRRRGYGCLTRHETLSFLLEFHHKKSMAHRSYPTVSVPCPSS